MGNSPTNFFETRVRPLLAEKCFSCHTQTKMGGLEMVSRAALLRGGNRGPAVKPGAPERSLLIRAVRYEDEHLKMPPTEQLSVEEIRALTQWVDEGAVWPEATPDEGSLAGGKLVITEDHRRFWAFQPVRKSRPPDGTGTAIDRFLHARLQKAGIEPAPPADKRTLLRRVFYDLIGLPPTPEQVDGFLADDSRQAFATVVDQLLASPLYGERWGRHWLDVARYSDDRLNSTEDELYPNAWRYRDWVIAAFNDDMPYDLFVKAQLAGDQLSQEERGSWSTEQLVAGLGLFGLSPKFQDDRIDLTGRGFLGLTVACAQCHDHKFDPIPTEDYYALLGVFNSTETQEYALAEDAVVADYKSKKKLADDAKEALEEFLRTQSVQLVDALAAQTSQYLVAAWRVSGPDRAPVAATASQAHLDAETLERWIEYLNAWPKQHKLLDEWRSFSANDGPVEAVERFANRLEERVLHVIREKKRIERENEIRLAGDRSPMNIRRTALLALPREEFYLWNDVASPNGRKDPKPAQSGVLYYKAKALERFLSGIWIDHIEKSRQHIAELESQVPEKYPFLHVIADTQNPGNEHVHIRGDSSNLGNEVPRRFLQILCTGEPPAFGNGSGRLDLARAIASPDNPLTARVLVNRVWMHHFGRGLVPTPSNFGMMGERPSHPSLLDYLAGRFVEGGWSIKSLHREILLTDAYRRSSRQAGAGQQADPDNRLLWRWSRRRLDVESLRDSLLYVAGRLSERSGGPPGSWDSSGNRRRTVYNFVSRRRLDTRLGLFDFPNPNQTSPRRYGTNTPLQGLFFLNSKIMREQAHALAERLAVEAGDSVEKRIRRGYRLLFGRVPTARELALNRHFVEHADEPWERLAQTWLSSNEFLYVN